MYGGLQRICKLACEDVRSLKVDGTEEAVLDAARTARVAAFAAVAALTVTTQKDAKFYAIPLRAPDSSSAGAWLHSWACPGMTCMLAWPQTFLHHNELTSTYNITGTCEEKCARRGVYTASAAGCVTL